MNKLVPTFLLFAILTIGATSRLSNINSELLHDKQSINSKTQSTVRKDDFNVKSKDSSILQDQTAVPYANLNAPQRDAPQHHRFNNRKDLSPRAIQCVDESDRPVDWIIFYKLPRVKASPNALIVNGEAYMFVSSEDVKRFEQKRGSSDQNKSKVSAEKRKRGSNKKNQKTKKHFKKVSNEAEKRDNGPHERTPFEDNEAIKKVGANSNNMDMDKHVEIRKTKKVKSKQNKLSGIGRGIQSDGAISETNSRRINRKKSMEDQRTNDNVDSNSKMNGNTNDDKSNVNPHQYPYYAYSFNTNHYVNSDEQLSKVNPLQQSYSGNNLDSRDIKRNDEEKSIMDKLKDALMKQFAKDARDQIDIERGDFNDLDAQNKAQLLENELADGNGKRRVERDVNHRDVYWNNARDNDEDHLDNFLDTNKDEIANRNSQAEIKFSDSIRNINSLLTARKVRESMNALKPHHSGVENDKKIDRDDLFEIIRAVELLNESDDGEGADSVDEVVDTSSQSDNSESATTDRHLRKTSFETVDVGNSEDNDGKNDDIDSEYKKSDQNNYSKLEKNDNLGNKSKYPPRKGTSETTDNPRVTVNKVDNRTENLSSEIPSFETSSNDHRDKVYPSTIAGKPSHDDLFGDKTEKLEWTLSTYSVRDPQSLPGKILSPLLFNSSYAPEFSRDGLKILYNDQTPNSTTVKFGHSKGLVIGNSGGGMWIVHSVPHFVDDSQTSYTYPHTGLVFGQNFLCLSLNRSELDSIGHNLGHNQVYKYSTYMSDSTRALFPTLARVVDGTYATSENYFTGTVHTRFDAVRFRTFAKTRELGEDLYKYIGRDLNASLLVETWPNGPGRLHTDCERPGHLVENVAGINASGVVAFRSTHDHAKWTISLRSAGKRNATIGGETRTHENRRKRMVEGFESVREAILDTILGKHNSQPENDEDSETDAPGNLSHERSNELDAYLSDADESVHNFDVKTETMDGLLNHLDTENNVMVGIQNYVENDDTEQKDLDGAVHSLDDMDSRSPIADSHKADSVEENSYPYENIEKSLETDGSILNEDFEGDTENLISDVDDLMDKSDSNGSRAVTENSLDLSANPEGLTENSLMFMEFMEGSRYFPDLTPNVDQSGNTVDEIGYFVCNGDINRAEDQLKRGGGSVCFDNAAVWTLYSSLVSDVEPCPRA